MSHLLNYATRRHARWLSRSDAGRVSSGGENLYIFYLFKKKRKKKRRGHQLHSRRHTSLVSSARHLPSVKTIKQISRFEKDRQGDRVRPRTHFILLLNSVWRAAHWVLGYAAVWLLMTRYFAAGEGRSWQLSRLYFFHCPQNVLASTESPFTLAL